jgi:hypothetical protein
MVVGCVPPIAPHCTAASLPVPARSHALFFTFHPAHAPCAGFQVNGFGPDQMQAGVAVQVVLYSSRLVALPVHHRRDPAAPGQVVRPGWSVHNNCRTVDGRVATPLGRLVWAAYMVPALAGPFLLLRQ